MKCLYLWVAVLVGVVLPVYALESVAMSADTPSSCPNEMALQQKVANLTRLVRIMEEQINKCAQQQGLTCPSVLMPHTERTLHTVADKPGAEEPAVPQTTNLPAPAPAYVPATRYGGGFRVAPEPRLTCDDYSESYFQRHPTMARVCGRGEPDVSATVPDEAAPAAVSATLLPTSPTVSPSAL